MERSHLECGLNLLQLIFSVGSFLPRRTSRRLGHILLKLTHHEQEEIWGLQKEINEQSWEQEDTLLINADKEILLPSRNTS